MNNDEILAELGTMISNLTQRVKERDAVIEQLRDIIAEYEGIQEPKKMYDTKGNFVGTVMPMSQLRKGRLRKACPHWHVEHTVRIDGGMYKHWIRPSSGGIKLCPGIWMVNS